MLGKLLKFAANARPFKASTALLGVDVGSSAIKIIELSPVNRGYRLENFGLIKLPQGAVCGETFADVHAIGATLATVIRSMGTASRRAAVAVSGSAVITRTIRLSGSLTDAELEDQIIVEADQYIPYPLDEVSIDFQRQGACSEDPDRTEVVLAACRTESVEARVAAMRLAGLEARVVDVEAHAVARACSLVPEVTGSRRAGAVAIIDVGALASSLCMVQGDRTVCLGEKKFNGNALCEALQRQLGLSPEEAEIRLRNGSIQGACESEIIAGFREQLVQQIIELLQLGCSSGYDREVDHVLLAGGVAALDGLADYCQQRLAKPVTIANPFADMDLADGVNSPALASVAPAFTVACGLALWGQA